MKSNIGEERREGEDKVESAAVNRYTDRRGNTDETCAEEGGAKEKNLTYPGAMRTISRIEKRKRTRLRTRVKEES